VAAIRQVSANGQHLKTFSAVFPGYSKDESVYINEVTKYLSLESYAVSPNVDSFIADFEKMLLFHDEPVGSMSIYIQYKVFELAKQNGVKVLLDGQGADELLAGYTKYIHWYLQEQYLLKGRKLVNAEISAFRNNNIAVQWNWRNYMAARLPSLAARILKARTVRIIQNDPFLTEDFKQAHFNRNTVEKPVIKGLNDILHYDSVHSVLPELLRYADRNSMAHGREVRLPFLDHKLAGFLFYLPADYKMNKGYGKRLLRLSMEQFLPPTITWRKDKIGFEAPQELWMQDKKMHEYIMDARKKLVNNRMLKSSVMEKNIQPLETHAAENYDWRYLVAAGML
jgi:asparagine synthase (glutamine-hydrolysing)